MRTLEPKIGDQKHVKVEYIVASHIYAKITDYGEISLLREVLLGPGNSIWVWIVMKNDTPIDVYHSHKIRTFNEAINRFVNDLYCTVYEFKDFNEMLRNWDNIKYINGIGTVYQKDQK